jgi:FkbM family methyltransferase
MRTDIKHGFIVTYFRSSDESEKLLSDMIEVLSKENFYLVLAAHSLVPVEIQQKCDFFIYESLNISDDRKYSHGVAESSLIEMSLNHLKYQNIEWTFKTCYDIILNDVSVFSKVTNNYKFPFVTCNWGDHFICTHTFFANVDFILNNINFYKTVEEMFQNSNVLELCWQNDILNKNLKDQLYIYESKAELFGNSNIIDVVGFNYHNVEFWYEEQENKFYVKNNGVDYSAELRIFDYYSDTCLYVNKDFNQPKGAVHWIVSPVTDYLKFSKNGYYLEIYLENKTITKNILIKDFRLKDPNSKKFKRIKRKEVKFNEYCDFTNFDLYSEFGIDIKKINNYVDIGACYGLSILPFLENNCKIYMIEPDTNNLDILKDIWSNSNNIKIIDKAISDTNGVINFYIEENLSVVSSIFEKNALGNENGRKSIEIESITPNNLIENYIDESEIDLMKVDIEGAEYQFFENITKENLSKVKRFIIEFHNNEDFRVMNILKTLAKNGFRYKLSKWQNWDDDFIISNKMGIIYAEKTNKL